MRKWLLVEYTKNKLKFEIDCIISNLEIDDYPRVFYGAYDREKIAELIIEYCTWIIKEIADSGVGCIEITSVYEKIDELLDKYEKEKVLKEVKEYYY